MFGRSGHTVLGPLAHRNVSAIRSDTRNLIRLANLTEDRSGRGSGSVHGAAGTAARLQAVTFAEKQLTSSILLAVTGEVTIHAIVSDVIAPLLRDAVLVSEQAQAAVLRAASTAQRGIKR